MSGRAAYVIIAPMTEVLIILLVVALVVVGASLALGRTTHEVESARDTEYLELEGTWVRYNVIGGGPPVVLVHGWLSSSMVWENLAGRLAQRFTVYTLDLAGFGESDKPLSGYGVRYGSRILYAFCAHFGLARVNIIGHDLGGNMAVKLAADHPDVVGRIVLVATPANEEQIDLPTPLWAATLPVIGPIFYMLGRAVRPVRAMWMKPFVSEPEDLTEGAIEDAASSTPAAMSQTLSVSKREIGGGRLARQARIIKVPVLIIAGEEDQIVDPQSAGVWARSFDNADVCLMDECGHMPMIERTGEFNAQILAFLTGDARYLEYVERYSEEEEDDTEDGEHIAEDVGDDTANFDTREVPTDDAPDTSGDEASEAPDIRREKPSGSSDHFGGEAEGEDEAPAFGPPPGERREAFPRRLERERESSMFEEESDEEARSEPIRGEDPREKKIRENEIRRREREARGDDFRAAPTDEPADIGPPEESSPDDGDDAPPPVVRRLGDRLSGRSGRRRSEEEEPDKREDALDPLEDETSELDSPRGGAFDEPTDDETAAGPMAEPPASDESPPAAPRPRRRRPRRESSSDDDVIPEMPSDLFDWGSTWDEDIKRPRERPPRRSRPEESEGLGGPGEPERGPDGEDDSNGSSEEPPRF
ncbi:hypothetical protein BH20ACT10_BH20ACT10_02170 [soil metagenome]